SELELVGRHCHLVPYGAGGDFRSRRVLKEEYEENLVMRSKVAAPLIPQSKRVGFGRLLIRTFGPQAGSLAVAWIAKENDKPCRSLSGPDARGWVPGVRSPSRIPPENPGHRHQLFLPASRVLAGRTQKSLRRSLGTTHTFRSFEVRRSSFNHTPR